jgi:hypothetical protein
MLVSSTNPEEKDYVRALGLESKEGIPDSGKASRMAKAIKDPVKLIRRSKAVVGIWGTENMCWQFFKEELSLAGFTEKDILNISQFEIDEDNL